MANKKINQLVTKTSIGTSDLFMIGDASTGQLYKKTIADLQATLSGTISGSGSAGYITKFSGTTAIANSVMYETASKIGLGTLTPGYALDVVGTIRASTDVIISSDARIKENINLIENALDKTCALEGVYYTRTDLEDKSRKVGFIAQQVAEFLPEVVSIDQDGNYGVNYGNITALLVEAIKELNKEIEILKAK
jgi:hypothetical protein